MINWLISKLSIAVLKNIQPVLTKTIGETTGQLAEALLSAVTKASSPKQIGYTLTKPTAQVPRHSREGDACMDVFAPEDIVIHPKSSQVVMTGVKFQDIPEDWKIVVLSRSGLSAKKWTSVLNSPGQVDENYRGELGVILFNHGEYPLTIKQGDAIAQVALEYVYEFEWVEMDQETPTNRGENGFGSSDKKEQNQESQVTETEEVTQTIKE